MNEVIEIPVHSSLQLKHFIRFNEPKWYDAYPKLADSIRAKRQAQQLSKEEIIPGHNSKQIRNLFKTMSKPELDMSKRKNLPHIDFKLKIAMPDISSSKNRKSKLSIERL